MNPSYSIPETAKLTGIPEHAIREYARQFADVLPTPEVNGEGGRGSVKRYPDSALAIFRSIRKLKDEGLDTAQIRSALQNQWDQAAHWDDIALKTAAENALASETTGEPERQCESDEVTSETRAEAVEAADVWAEESTSGETLDFVEEGGPCADGGAWAESEAVAETTPQENVEPAPADEAVWVESEAGTEWTQGAASGEETAAVAEAEAEVTVRMTEAPSEVPYPFHPLFANLNDGLRQLRVIMDEYTSERALLREQRDRLLEESAAKSAEIEHLQETIRAHEEKIGSLQTALNLLMNQCDQQLQAIRSALGQA